MSQWAIDGVGRSLDIFNQLKNAAERGVKLSVLFTAHDTAKMDTGFAPYDLINHQLKDGQVRLKIRKLSGTVYIYIYARIRINPMHDLKSQFRHARLICKF